MVPRLVDYLNQSILVSIPVLHSEVKCRSYILVGADLQGLWLQSEALLHELFDVHGEVPPASTPVFVPFSHIAFVVVSAPPRKIAGFPASLRTPVAAPTQAPTAAGRSTKETEVAHKRKLRKVAAAEQSARVTNKR